MALAPTSSRGSSGSSPLSVLGPFPFAYNDVGIDTGVLLTPIPSGTTLIRAWAIVRTAWTLSAGIIGVQLAIGPTVNWSDSSDTVTAYSAGTVGQNPLLVGREMYPDTWAAPPLPIASRCIAAGVSLGVFSFGAITGGASDAYALLWTP